MYKGNKGMTLMSGISVLVLPSLCSHDFSFRSWQVPFARHYTAAAMSHERRTYSRYNFNKMRNKWFYGKNEKKLI